MPQYYIPNKNRCKIACTEGYKYPFFICNSIPSNMNTTNKKSYTVAKQYENKVFDNNIKRGSGGNSYEAYLSNKRGLRIINECKNNDNDCWTKCNM